MRRFPSIGLVLLLLFPAAARAEESALEREQRLLRMRQEVQRLELELGSLKSRESGLIGELERLGGELRLAEAELEKVGAELVEVTRDFESVAQRLEKLEQTQEERRRYLSFRLREMYKSGADEALRRFLADADADDYWDGLRYAAYLSERDARVIESFRRDVTRSAEERQRLEQRRSELLQLQTELDATRSRLTAARNNRTRLLRSVRTDRSQRRRAIDELNAAAGELGRVVGELSPDAGPVALDVKKFKGLLAWPAEGRVTAGFGTKIHPRFKTRVPHPGLDIDAGMGSKIRSVFDGKVVFAAWMRGYGLTVIVDHGGGLLSIYAHAAVLLVEPGERVQQEQQLGMVGDTGSLSGPFLYFELRLDGKAVDPAGWLRKRR